ncbi:hypothetical protein A7U60_g5961 [Sanghuangporus baumii]|uniref:DUF6534 domain-containing protein n=1 Tax=Sanghuangporus baumii TaxID=108892 RepID=A0A9Q5NB15_SANBA|nr:hypothetical protein A7U60_g5961 [Sanghuangporus baumii]
MSTNLTNHESLAAVAPTVHIRLDGSLGAILVGLIFASILFGIANVQTLIYYQNSSNDPRYMKWMSAVLNSERFEGDVSMAAQRIPSRLNFECHLSISCDRLRQPSRHYKELLGLMLISLQLAAFVSLLITRSISLVYTYRVWIMSNRNWVLTLGAFTLILVEFAHSHFGRICLQWLGYMSLGSAAASDLWCAVCLCYYLAKDRTGFKTTDTKLNSLMLYIISTGLLTSLCAICCLILFAAAPHGYSYIAVHFCLSKLYFSALLALFNSRNYLREEIPGRTSVQEAYRLPQIVNIHRQPSSEHEASFGAIQDKMPSSSYKE